MVFCICLSATVNEFFIKLAVVLSSVSIKHVQKETPVISQLHYLHHAQVKMLSKVAVQTKNK